MGSGEEEGTGVLSWGILSGDIRWVCGWLLIVEVWADTGVDRLMGGNAIPAAEDVEDAVGAGDAVVVLEEDDGRWFQLVTAAVVAVVADAIGLLAPDPPGMDAGEGEVGLQSRASLSRSRVILAVLSRCGGCGEGIR